jgi:hypothetical protein
MSAGFANISQVREALADGYDLGRLRGLGARSIAEIHEWARKQGNCDSYFAKEIESKV